MRILAFVLNAVFILFTCFVMITEGSGDKVGYRIFGIFLLVIPVLNMVVLGWTPALKSALANKAAIILNVVLFVLVCAAIINQYPHPDEAGFIEFVALAVLIPALSAVAIYRSGALGSRKPDR